MLLSFLLKWSYWRIRYRALAQNNNIHPPKCNQYLTNQIFVLFSENVPLSLHLLLNRAHGFSGICYCTAATKQNVKIPTFLMFQSGWIQPGQWTLRRTANPANTNSTLNVMQLVILLHAVYLSILHFSFCPPWRKQTL